MLFQEEINYNIKFYFQNINLKELDVFSDILINNIKNNIFILGIGKSFNIGKHLSDLLKCINFKRSLFRNTGNLLRSSIELKSNGSTSFRICLKALEFFLACRIWADNCFERSFARSSSDLVSRLSK